MPNLEPLVIIIRGRHDTGKTTVASFVKMALEESGFRHVSVKDVEPLPSEAKDDFMVRLARNRERPIHIIVELEP